MWWVLIVGLFVLPGCLVKPYQRELLALPSMSLETPPGGEAVEHALDSREGSVGGVGASGGGCGCN